MIKFKEKEPILKTKGKELDIIVATAAAALLLPEFPLLALAGGLYFYHKVGEQKEQGYEDIEYRIHYILEQYKADLALKLLDYGVEKEKIELIIETVINQKYLEEIIRH